ncbi:cobalamin B12-binding domain-containing protein [Saccharothrix algeriensis]|uniref:Cobalamin-dependent protein n=1 Tax=Saccharothrix algeriensis TaxID=173560 RepID=A0A8T8HYV5_9PSEU|nr:cobalamin-dependent protein [Saccharothrix algeriensis]MBM7809324.1 methanogenic corrinoid protein MtbC1 [Saccharothrix algeriensis]QTR03666.1 cobalamin-dependent protein [Saccharothrix algeriensis]
MTAVPRAVDARDCAGWLWDAVVAGDEHRATEVVLAAVADGLDTEAVLLDVIGAVQRRVGAEWAANRLTVAQEHAATAINDRVIAALTASSTAPGPRRGRITVACVDGEWHALPARLLAEVLKLRGFHVDYLGAQVPVPHLITHLHSTGPDAVALSGSLATRLPTAHATITACQATGVPVLVGGGAFGADGRYARLLGADFWAPDARTAGDRLAGGPLPRPRGGHQPIDDLPHLNDQEYTMVSRTRGQLVKAAYTGLEARFPVMGRYTEQQREHTAEDLAHIVDFLAAALYTDDDELFTGFLRWTSGVLDARGVPSRFLPPALTLLGAELRDFPRATRILRRAHDQSTRAPGPAERPEHEPGPAA